MEDNVPDKVSPMSGPITENGSTLNVIQTDRMSTSRSGDEDDNASHASSISSIQDNDLSNDEEKEDGSPDDDLSYSSEEIEVETSKVNVEAMSNAKLSMAESINWLGRHIPRCVLKDLYKEVIEIRRREDKVEMDDIEVEAAADLPMDETYSAALLFIDISGFTKLSQMLNLENLSKNINEYFQKIVDEVIDHGGDILKFAGDAVFVEWRVNKKYASSTPKGIADIERCVHEAATCGASVVAKCTNYPVFQENKQVSILDVHCGLAYGRMAGIHFGNARNRREFVVLGDSIDLVSTACDAATHGELMASPEAYEILMRGSRQRRKAGAKPAKVGQPVLIAKGQEIFFEKRKKKFGLGLIKKGSQQKKEFTLPFDKMDMTSMKHLKRLISYYAHPVVVSDELSKKRSQRRGSIVSASMQVDQERQRSEAELRSVYTIFIKALVKSNLSNDSQKNNKTFSLLNDIFSAVTSILDGYKGHLRQFIVDDKGVILIATFGLRGSTSPNMAPDRVLPCSRAIHYVLQNDHGVDNYVGTTLGLVYCGVVGSIKRHEYAVLGPSVNLAARLLGMPNHPGVLINGDVRREAIKWGSFFAYPPMKAKGYSYLVPVFQPLSATEARWGKSNPLFVGRKEEIKQVCQLAKDMTLFESEAKMFFVWGETGAGKSEYLVQTFSWLRKLLAKLHMRIIFSRNIGNEGDSLVPFSLFKNLFKDLLGEGPVTDSASYSSHMSKVSNKLSEKDFDALSLSSASTAVSKGNSSDRLNAICEELGAPSGFAELVGYNLLGHAKTSNPINAKTLKLDEIVDFMAKLFIYCTSHADLTVVVLDDLHQADNMSWKVVQRIFETGKNILFLCGSRPLGSHKLNVDKDFWGSLNTQYKVDKRYQELNMGSLGSDEIAKMASIVLGCKGDEVDKAFVKDIYDHTGGMPHYAFQAISNCKKKGLFERLDNNKYGWKKGSDNEKMEFLSLDELLLQRIDELDDFTRKTLHLASVLGHTFSLFEISAIAEQAFSVEKELIGEHINRIRESLDAAVKETILDAVAYAGASETKQKTSNIGDNGKMSEKSDHSVIQLLDNETENKHYQFCHDTWRQKILSLILDSYKRDIHMYAASAIEMSVDNIEEADYGTKMKLFLHLKQSGNTCKAADLALSVGKSFSNLGLNEQCVQVYNAALDMWRRKGTDDNDDEEYISGISLALLEGIDEKDLVNTVKLLTALGQALATLLRKVESGKAFEDALEIFKKAPVNKEIKDRTFLFPIYSGLFLLLKYGGMVEPDQANTYEQKLVMNYVAETKANRDPVHYSRALAMQGEFYSRQGEYEKALECHERLKRVYDVKKHSKLVVQHYSSDRSAQNYGNGANCLYRLGRTKEALEVCDLILDKLMPQMDLKNVHNSMIMIYPTLWVLKNENMPSRALTVLEKFVFEPFDTHFGEEGKTFSLVMFKPLRVLFSILIYLESGKEYLDESHTTWALQPDSLDIPKVVNNSFASFARCGTSICAEICLLLSKEVKDVAIADQLIQKGWVLAQKAMEVAQDCGEHQTTYFETKPIYDEISLLVEK